MTKRRRRRSLSKSTLRSRLCRRRQRDGKWTVPVEVEIELARYVLKHARLLGEWDFENRRAISQALSEAVALWLADSLQRAADRF
jgi:hypothetical protein